MLPKRFLTDLAVNAKSCVNSNVKPYIYQFMIVLSTLGISKRDIEETILLQYPLFQAFSNYQIFAVFLLFIVNDYNEITSQFLDFTILSHTYHFQVISESDI